MYIFATIDMPEIFKQRMPWKNSTEHDTPLYEKSIAIFTCVPNIENELILSINELEFVGFNPFVNTKVSNTSPHKILRGKTFRPGIYLGVTQVFKPKEAWKHKAIHLCNTELLKKVKLQLSKNVVVTKPGSAKIISEGISRAIPTDFTNPVHNAKYMSGCLIHRGPKKNLATQNMSLGCVTVEQDLFDGMMKFVEYDELVVYVHLIDQLIHEKDNSTINTIKGVDNNFVKVMYDLICSNINRLVGK